MIKKLEIKTNLSFICPIIFALCFSFLLTGLLFAEDNLAQQEELSIAKKALSDGFYPVSRRLFDRFIKNWPDSPLRFTALVSIGQSYFYEGKYQEAQEEFKKIIDDPAAEELKDAALYLSGELNFEAKDYSKAKEYYTQVVNNFPNSSYAAMSLYSLGWCYFNESDYRKAMNVFNKLKEKFPKDPLAEEAYLKIAECAYKLQDYKPLIAYAQDAISEFSQSRNLPILYFYKAEAEYYLGDYLSSVTDYACAAANKPDMELFNFINLGMGWAYIKVKNYQEADVHLNKIISLPKDENFLESFYMAKGVLAGELTRYQEMLDDYNILLRISKSTDGMFEGYLGKAEALYNLGSITEAIEVYKDGLSKTSDQDTSKKFLDKIYYGLAWAYLKNGNFKDAIESFQKVLSSSSDEIVTESALCQLADTYQEKGDLDIAASTYNQILVKYPDGPYKEYVGYQLGIVLIKQEKYDEAIGIFQEALRDNSETKLEDGIIYYLAVAHYQKSDFTTAKEKLSLFFDKFKESKFRKDALYLFSLSAANMSNFEEAISYLNQLIGEYPDDNELVMKSEYQIAEYAYKLGKQDDAVKKFTEFSLKYPKSDLASQALYWLGDYFYRQKKTDEALNYFNEIIRDYPDSKSKDAAYYSIGSIYLADNNLKEALDIFQKISGSTDEVILTKGKIQIALILEANSEFDSAVKIYRELLEKSDKYATDIYPKLAGLYRKMGKYDDSIENYRNLLKISSQKDGTYQIEIAEMLQEEGKLDLSIDEYLKAVYLYPSDKQSASKAYLRVAEIYEDNEECQKALMIYQKLKELDVPESKFAQAKIDEYSAKDDCR